MVVHTTHAILHHISESAQATQVIWNRTKQQMTNKLTGRLIQKDALTTEWTIAQR